MTPLTALIEMLFLTSRSQAWLRRLLPLADPERSGYVQKLYGGCLLARREVLESIGWFDERYFMYAEDADLSRTIVQHGWKLYYCSEASLVHVGGGVTAAAPSGFSILMQQESINKLIRKYQGAGSGLLHRLVVLGGAMFRLAVLSPLWIAAALRRGSRFAGRVRQSCFKQRQLALWALGLKKAAVPRSRAVAGAGWAGGVNSR